MKMGLRLFGIVLVLAAGGGYAEHAAHPDETVALPGLAEGATPLTVCYIPSGKFMMGSPLNEGYGYQDWHGPATFRERPRRETTITQGFWMGKHEVTSEQFAAFVKATDYVTSAEKAGESFSTEPLGMQEKIPGLTWRNPGIEQAGGNHPVVHVSHDDAKAFCGWLSRESGDQWMLPSEAQWEYACRAGTSTAFFWGDRAEAGKGYVNGCDSTLKARFPERLNHTSGMRFYSQFEFEDGYVHTSPVGSFSANGWGLHDMIGNVSEWCRDRYDAAYYTWRPAVDPLNDNEKADFRVVRNGSWVSGPTWSRAASRGGHHPAHSDDGIGFRVVRVSR